MTIDDDPATAPMDTAANEATKEATEVGVLNFPGSAARWPATLTSAEREVAELLLEGETNLAISKRRGTSRRTVTNQVASIFRKVGVASRIELAARVFG